MKISAKFNQSIWLKLLLFVPLYFLLYFVMVQYQTVCELGGRLFMPISLKTIIDAWTPVNIYIMWPYLACLVYVPFSGILFALNRRISAIQIISFYFSVISMYLITYVIYIVFPTTASGVMLTSFEPNANLFINEGMFQALQDLYAQSTPLGDFPSLHVAPLVFMGIFLYRYWRSLFWLFLPFAFFGAIGTFVLKFHTFAGFIGGVVMGAIGFYIFYERLVYKYLSKIVASENIINK
jgi:hypothetical protein